MLILVVDDERLIRDRAAMHVRTADDAKLVLRALKTFDELWLDHDLGPHEDIMDLVKWLEELIHNGEPIAINRIYVHTANPVGAQNIFRALGRHYEVHRASLDHFV